MRVVGLQSAAWQKLNGAEGTIVKFDSAAGRWHTTFDDGAKQALKAREDFALGIIS